MANYDIEHKTMPLGSNHPTHDLEFADAAARTAHTYVSTDIGKDYRQLDTDTFWKVISVSGGAATFREVAATPVDIGDKEPTIAAGTASQYFRGDKTWQSLVTTSVTEGTNLYFTASRAIGSALTGLTTTAETVTDTDTILSAIGKLVGNLAQVLIDAKTYADSLVIGLLDDRGSYDASSNLFPDGTADGLGNLGGSGLLNAIKKGDLWFIRTGGVLGGVTVGIGTSVRAMTDAPGQTAANWSIISTTLGFTPENIANKSTGIGSDPTSTTKYPHFAAVYDWATGLFATIATVSSIDSATATSVASIIAGVSAKTTPVDADLFTLDDSAASNDLKHVTWANIKATLKTYFDTLYPPLITQRSISTDAAFVLADANNSVLHPSADTTARTFTIPANSSVAYPVGSVITIVNQHGAGVITIAITTDTMYLAGAGTTGSRTLAANGVATAYKVTATEWLIFGNGLT